MSTISIIILIISVFAIALGLVQIYVFKNDKGSIEKQYKLADEAFKQGNFKKAKELLIKIRGAVVNSETEKRLGLVYLKLGEHPEAKKCFDEVLKKSPKDSEALFNMAQILERQGQQYDALEIYTKLLGDSNKNIESYLSFGRINLENKNFEKALEILERARDLSPDNLQVQFSIAKCKSELSEFKNHCDYKTSIAEYLKFSNSEDLPEDFEISLAKLYAKNGQMNESLTFCKKALDKDERDVEAYKLLGLIQLIKKEYASAKSNLMVALEFEPSDAEAHNIFSYLLCIQANDCSLGQCREKYNNAIKKYLEE